MPGGTVPSPSAASPRSIAVVAPVWAVFQFLNISWPRPVYVDQRYLDWSVWLAVLVLGALGAAIYAIVRGRLIATSVIDAEEEADEAADEAADGPPTRPLTSAVH